MLDTVAEHAEQCAACSAAIAQFASLPDPLVTALRQTDDALPLDSEELNALVDSIVALHDLARPDRPGTPATASETPVAGRVGRRYELLRRLGQGGMGTVYLARHVHLDKIVALKVVAPERIENPRAVARFEREMRAVGRLHHPHIVGAHDAGEAGGQHFLVMEYVDGWDLAEVVRRLGPLTVADGCELIRQAALGLAHAHEHGMVHRDIKPSNLMLSRGGIVKVLDLGLARLQADTNRSELTGDRQALGTADYMAPEQVEGSHEVDIRADIYSLGCTLFRLLAGRAPFASPEFDTPARKMLAHVGTAAPSLANLRPEAPAALVQWVAQMVAKSPADRPGTPLEVAQTLATFTAIADLSAIVQRLAESDVERGPADPASLAAVPVLSTSSHGRPIGRRRWIAGGLTALALVGVGVGSWAFWASHRTSPPETADLRAARWVLATAGTIVVEVEFQRRRVERRASLPTVPFWLVEVEFRRDHHVRDADLSQLVGTEHLERLTLDASHVTDGCLEHLSRLTSLAELDVSGTLITPQGRARLRAALPQCRITP